MGIPAPSAVKGRIRNIYEALYVWVVAALEDADYSDYFVSMDYKFNVMSTTKNPIVTMRITPTTHEDVFFGRVWQGDTEAKALQTRYLFSFHIFSRYNTGHEEDHNRDAWVVARIVESYIGSLSRTTLDTKGIRYFDDIRMRESDPRIRQMGRIIMDGEIMVTREDSP